MAALFYTTLASRAIVINNADNFIFCTFVPEVAEDNCEQQQTSYDDVCSHYLQAIVKVFLIM
jgi:hypothetical protein